MNSDDLSRPRAKQRHAQHAEKRSAVTFRRQASGDALDRHGVLQAHDTRRKRFGLTSKKRTIEENDHRPLATGLCCGRIEIGENRGAVRQLYDGILIALAIQAGDQVASVQSIVGDNDKADFGAAGLIARHAFKRPPPAGPSPKLAPTLTARPAAGFRSRA